MIASTQTNHPLHRNGAESSSDDRVQAACEKLRHAGLRITQPRIAILSVLIAGAKPLSIEQIHDKLHSDACDLVTVYRCLAAFEDIGLVRRSFFHNGTSLYHLSDHAETTYHVVSKRTQAIAPLDAATSARLAETLSAVETELKAKGYSEVGHLLEFFGEAPEAPTKRARAGQVQLKTV
jgi:Fur family transcriptional regulator, ferric uptake regulator